MLKGLRADITCPSMAVTSRAQPNSKTHHHHERIGSPSKAPSRVPRPCHHSRAQNRSALPRKTRRRYVRGIPLNQQKKLIRTPYIPHDPSETPNKTAEDNLNIALRDITVTGRDGRVSQLDQVYIRGSMVRFFIVPDMLQNAPMSVPFHLPDFRRSDFAFLPH